MLKKKDILIDDNGCYFVVLMILFVLRARRAIRVFLYLRDVTLHLNQELETALPLTKVNVSPAAVRLCPVYDLFRK